MLKYKRRMLFDGGGFEMYQLDQADPWASQFLFLYVSYKVGHKRHFCHMRLEGRSENTAIIFLPWQIRAHCSQELRCLAKLRCWLSGAASHTHPKFRKKSAIVSCLLLHPASLDLNVQPLWNLSMCLTSTSKTIYQILFFPH